MNALPAEAETLVSRIESLLAQAERLLASGGNDESAFALRETERRYLPDTLKAYEDIPPARRDATAAEMLVGQLRLLERATAQRLAALAERAETALAANGAFLTERFGPLESLPETQAEPVDPAHPPPAMLVRRVLDRLGGEDGADPIAVIERAAVRLSAAFPTIVTVRRSGLLGRGPVEQLTLDVPRADDLLRYALERSRHGHLEATVTRYLRGIKNKTIAVDIGEWTQGLIADLGTYVERERGARELLTRLFRETR